MTNSATIQTKTHAAKGWPKISALALAVALFNTGCASLEPALPEADPGIQGAWPKVQADEANADGAATVSAADVGWRDFLVDQKLEEVVARALANNRDLRVALLNVERARALYRIQYSARLPSVGANAAMIRGGGDRNPNAGESYSAELGLSAFELDLFGRVRNLSDAALEQYLAQEEASRGAQLSLVAEVINAYLTLAADQELLQVAQATLQTYERSYQLSQKRHELGALSALDLSRSRTEVESARADTARFQGYVAQDLNALNLLVGAPVDVALLPTGFTGQVTGLLPLPAGLPSDVLLRRPDVLQAEHRLRAANANIGAARAAFFPSISLTGSIGTVSDELSGLFGSGSKVWSFIPQIQVPIFQGGRLRAQLGVSNADRDIALAQYERAIQQGFREVSDALALTATLAAQHQAQAAVVAAAQQADDLAAARYEAGQDSYLVRLDTQRTLYGAQQGLVAIRLAEQANRVALYRVLGGGWKEQTE